MCWEFFKFWGGCIVTGWHIGDGIFGAVVEFCLLTSAGLFALKFLFKKFNWKKLWKKWEEIVMKWAFILFAVSFLIAAVFVAPFLEYEKANPSPLPAIPAIPKAAAKLLPTKIIPRSEPPPSPPPLPPTQQLAVVETPAVATQMQFELFNADTGAVGIAETKIDKKRADLEAKAEADKQALQLEIKKDWDNGLKNYRRVLVLLHDTLSDEAKKTGDGIVQSEGYFQCIPSIIDSQTSEIKAGTIGLQINTNVSFLITISELNSSGHRQVHVSCAAGDLELYPGGGNDFYARLNTYLGLPFDNYATGEKVDSLVFDNLNSLVAAQFMFISKTNGQ